MTVTRACEPPGREGAGVLPNLLIIGAMKCGTSALHRLLGAHPDVAMATPKELNFFVGPARAARGASWHRGNWHRGLRWYARHFEDAPVRGEASPGYTSPSFPEAAERIAAVLPAARLVYLVRDPVARAVSQYRHHRADGTERRSLREALLDPASQYLSRSCFHARLEPFLACFPGEQLFICAQEELLVGRRTTLEALHRFIDVDPRFRDPAFDEPPAVNPAALADRRLHAQLAAQLADDANRLRDLAGRDFPGWSL